MPDQSANSNNIPFPNADPEKAQKYLSQLIPLIDNDHIQILHTNLSTIDPTIPQDHYQVDIEQFRIEISHSKDPNNGQDIYLMVFNTLEHTTDGEPQKKVLAYVELTHEQFNKVKTATENQVERKKKAEEDKKFDDTVAPIDTLLTKIASEPASENNQTTNPLTSPNSVQPPNMAFQSPSPIQSEPISPIPQPPSNNFQPPTTNLQPSQPPSPTPSESGSTPSFLAQPPQQSVSTSPLPQPTEATPQTTQSSTSTQTSTPEFFSVPTPSTTLVDYSQPLNPVQIPSPAEPVIQPTQQNPSPTTPLPPTTSNLPQPPSFMFQSTNTSQLTSNPPSPSPNPLPTSSDQPQPLSQSALMDLTNKNKT